MHEPFCDYGYIVRHLELEHNLDCEAAEALLGDPAACWAEWEDQADTLAVQLRAKQEKSLFWALGFPQKQPRKRKAATVDLTISEETFPLLG